jgi:hypothetical protein
VPLLHYEKALVISSTLFKEEDYKSAMKSLPKASRINTAFQVIQHMAASIIMAEAV